MVSDTPHDVAELQAAMYRALPLERKLAIMAGAYRSGKELADAGLRLRKPTATKRDCLENWVRLTVPPNLVAQALEVVVETAESALAEVRHLARKLAPLDIELVIGGSVAGSLYTTPRHTHDADVSVEPFPGRERELVSRLEDEYYVSMPAVLSAVAKRQSFNVLRHATSFKIDIFVQAGRPFDRAAMLRRRELPAQRAGDPPIYVHSPEDVVLHKLAWYRLGNEVSERQWSDIVGILRMQRGHLDESYLGHWAEELKVADLWKRAAAEAM